MRLLLDTHAFIWWDNGELPRAVVRRIQQADEVFVSAVTSWEIAIKSALGKIDAKAPVAEAIADYGFSELPIAVAHGDAVRSLPPHHRDPFDRMLVVQAQIEGLSLVSRDRAFLAYSIPLVWSK